MSGKWPWGMGMSPGQGAMLFVQYSLSDVALPCDIDSLVYRALEAALHMTEK